MIARLRRLAVRLTVAERAVLVLLALQPAVWFVLAFGALWAWSPLGAAVLAASFIVPTILIAVLLGRRVARRAVARTNPQVGGLRGVAIGHHPDTGGFALSGTAGPGWRHVAETLARTRTAEALVRVGLHTRATVHRDALALRATRGRFDVSRLLEVAPAAQVDPVVWGDLDAESLIGVLRLTASLSPKPEGFDALLALAADRATGAAEPARLALAAVLIANDRPEPARRVLETVDRPSWLRDVAAIDLLNPFAPGGDPATEPAWLAAFNSLFRASGIEPLALSGPTRAEPFERLGAPAAEPGSSPGALVSVVMTVFRPGVEAVRAAESVLAQTWRNWELIVVDDASGGEFEPVLERLAALDARVRVLRAATNDGTYRRRNDGLDAARGTYVAFHDSDDWSHPRRLEIQVRALESRPAVPGVVVSALRATSDLRLSQPRGADLRLCEPSLMVRREEALGLAGYFDPIRRGADVEYRERLGAAAGRSVVHVRTAAPLVLMRSGATTLSGADFTEGWTHPARIVYRSMHRWWRSRAERRGESLRRDRDDATRPFPVPDRLAAGAPASREHDVLLLADLGEGVLARRELARLSAGIGALRGAGLRVAVRHEPGLMTGSQDRDLDRRMLDLIAREGAEIRVIDEVAHVDDLIILDPGAVLALPDDTEDGLVPRRVTAVDRVRRSRTGMPRDAVEDVVRRRWDLPVRWVADLPAAFERS